MKPETLIITNFTGRLTRVLNGDINSGFAKFATSWGYDPFSKPGNLTWLNQTSSIAGITDAVLSGQIISTDANAKYVYAIGSNAYLYQINPTNSQAGNIPLNDVSSVIANLNYTSVAGTFNYGADLDYYNNKLYITSDSTVVVASITGADIASVTGASSTVGTLYHPLVQFLGSLYVGNGDNLMQIDSTGLITNGAVLNPGLPDGMYISDLDITPDGTYMIITASYAYPPRVVGGSVQYTNPFASASYQFLWNGTDAGYTSYTTLPSFPSPTLATFSDKKYYFMNDAFGSALFEGNQKLLTLPNNITPVPNAATGNGTFLTWANPEIDNPTNDTAPASVYGSLYYFGQLDAQNQVGLWRLLRQSPQNDGDTMPSVPLNMMVNNYSYGFYRTVGWGKHYFSTTEFNVGSSASTFGFYRFVLPPNSDTPPLLGVYETQTQLFSKRIGINQIRVYVEPPASGAGFKLDLVGSDGNVITNGTFTYSYGDPIDGNERINFNPNTQTLYSFAVRITNTGTTNMTIKKIEIDYNEKGK